MESVTKDHFARGADSSREIRIDLAIFFILFFTYGYFHQGGGWNNNSRFAQIRAVVEKQQLHINDYLIYDALPGHNGKPKLHRLPATPPFYLDEIGAIGSTGDLAIFNSQLFPNKPPGVVFAAVPAYFFIYNLEHVLGIDPDSWWPLTFNAYSTTVLSVGLCSALGGVAFYRMSRLLFPSPATWTHVASALTLGLGTLLLPFATMLYGYGITVFASLVSLWLLLVHKNGGFSLVRPSILLFFSGTLTGLVPLIDYASFITTLCLMLYALWAIRPKWKVALFVGGMVPPLMLLSWYHLSCCGSVLANAYTYQNPIFQEQETLFLNMFGLPKPNIIIKLLFSAHRGLFLTAPVLALSFLGLFQMAARLKRHAEVALCIAIFLGFLSMNSSFHHWDGGWGIGPRYLIPALPFLAMPLPLVFEKLPRLTLALASFSALIMLLITAVDALPPAGHKNPLIEYTLPLAQGEKLPLFLPVPPGKTLIFGPVSANPIGVYESWSRRVFQPGDQQDLWNSFNLGEFLWPGSLTSLVPLLIFLGLGIGLLWQWCCPARSDFPISSLKAP